MLLIFLYLYVCCAEEEFSLFSPSAAPPQPGGIGTHEKLRGIKNVSLCNMSWFVHYQEVPLLWWTTERAGKKKRRTIPWRKLSRTLNPAGCQSCLWEEPWVWLLILSLCLARQFPGLLSMQGLLSPPSLISSSALPKQRASWHVNSRQQWIILHASQPLWLI